MKTLCIILFVFLSVNNIFGQKSNSEKISTESTSIDFTETEFRGFKYKGIVYFVENDMQTIKALKKGKLFWEKNVVLECEKSKSSKLQIQKIKLHKGYLHAIYGNTDIWIEPVNGSIFICGVY
ncbi:hypothetical protein [Flavobacterium sp. 3HN19-14]|uniref:hypothetical protein n=1 Tax=Flavobacterium sp. 3HN19-14 TaxID=3448133 RepID=UPI003EDFC95F